MYVSVITPRQPASLGGGLTYWSDRPLVPGSLVETPLRKRLTEGIVLALSGKGPGKTIKVKPVARTLGTVPLLPAPLLKTMRWMCEYYCCQPRQALQVFLAPPPWKNVLPEESGAPSAVSSSAEHRRKKSPTLHPSTEARPLGAASEGEGCPAVRGPEGPSGPERERAKRVEWAHSAQGQARGLAPASLDGEERLLAEKLMAEDRPSVLVDGKPGDDRTTLYAALALHALRRKKSALLLYPDIVSAEAAHARLAELLEPSADPPLLLHSGTGLAERRRLTRKLLLGSPAVVVGTRTALFCPAASPGLVVLDNEQEWTWKSEQTPRYHTRLTAEVLCRFANAKLILASSAPSIEALYHTETEQGEPARYHRMDRAGKPPMPRSGLRVIDLSDADFGASYPITSPLLAALRDRLKRREASVLLLNRKGTATSLMCFECKFVVLSPLSQLPMSVVTVEGKPALLDRPTGLRGEIPASCPHCGSVRLKAVGAGTEGVETVLSRLLPAARIARVDADSLDVPGKLPSLLDALDRGDLDILVGTRPVLRALSSPRVTLAAVLVADIGLSHPDFRAGERVFIELTRIIARMGGRKNALTLIQTFRPGSPEIAGAVSGRKDEYWKAELKLRRSAGYPPTTQMIRLIFRGKDARSRTEALYSLAMKRAQDSVAVTKTNGFERGRAIGTVTLRGAKPRELLRELPLRDSAVDVDPAE